MTVDDPQVRFRRLFAEAERDLLAYVAALLRPLQVHALSRGHARSKSPAR